MLLKKSYRLRRRSSLLYCTGMTLFFLLLTVASSSVRLTTGQSPIAAPTESKSASTEHVNPANSSEEYTTRYIQVLDLNRTPIANASVWLQAEESPPNVGTTDANGLLELKIKRHDDASDRTSLSLSTATLFAIAPDFSLQAKRLPSDQANSLGFPVQIVLPPASHLQLRIVSHNGAPLQNAKVTPLAMRSLTENSTNRLRYAPRDEIAGRASYNTTAIPTLQLTKADGLSHDAITGFTDKNGVVSLPGIQNSQLRYLLVEHETAGRQVHALPFEPAPRIFHEFEKRWHSTILLDSGEQLPIREIKFDASWSVAGKVTTENKDALKGLQISLIVLNQENNLTRSSETVPVREDGVFEAKLIAGEGSIRASSNLNPNIPLWPLVSRSEFNQDRTAREVDIELRQAYKVHGRVLEMQTGEPIPDADVTISPFSSDDRQAKTDLHGTYSIFLPPGRASLRDIRVPRDYEIVTKRWGEDVVVPQDADGFYLPKIEVKKTTTTRPSQPKT